MRLWIKCTGGAVMEIHQHHTNGDESVLVDLKYGDRDISESSLVYLRSKDGEAGCRTTTFIIHKTIL